MKDGAPFQIVGGDVHYFRIVPEVRFFPFFLAVVPALLLRSS